MAHGEVKERVGEFTDLHIVDPATGRLRIQLGYGEQEVVGIYMYDEGGALRILCTCDDRNPSFELMDGDKKTRVMVEVTKDGMARVQVFDRQEGLVGELSSS